MNFTGKSLEEFLKEYKQAEMDKTTKTIGIYRKTWLGLELLVEIYSQMFSRKTGILRRITKVEAVDIAVSKTISDILAEIKKAASANEKLRRYEYFI